MDKRTGKEVWNAEAASLELAYGTPLLAPLAGGGKELVIGVPYEVWGLNPDTGRLNWYAETGLDGNVAPSPVAANGIVYVFGGYHNTSSVAIRTGGKGDVTTTHTVWSSRDSSYVPSPVFHQGKLYWVSDQGIAFCADAETGETIYRERLSLASGSRGGKQTVVFSTKNPDLDRTAFTYNLERGGAGEIKPEPWIWATDLSGGWFYRATAVNKMSIPVMVGNAVDAISKNGVVMVNIALRGDGTIPDNQAAYLTAFGDFLKTSGEGIYGTRPWKIFGEGPLKMKDGRQGENHQDFSQEDIRFTQKDGQLFVFVLAPPTEDIVIKTLCTNGPLDGEITGIELLGSQEPIRWQRSAESLIIKLPKTLPGDLVNCFKIKVR